MKKIYLLTILALALVFPSFAQHEHSINIDHQCRDLDRMTTRLDYLQKQKSTAQAATLLTGDYDLKYHRFEWQVDPAVRYISGVVTTYFQPRVDGFEFFHFELSPDLQINAITYHGTNLSSTRLEEGVVQVALPSPLALGQLDSISIDYEGTPPVTDPAISFGAFEQAEHNGAPIIWTLSEPYGAKDWWPCKQDLNDKIDSIDVIVQVPEGNKVASNGVLIAETPAGEEVRFHWKHRYLIPAYLVAIAVTNYEAYSDFVEVDGAPDIEVLNYVYPENLDNAKSKTQDAVRMMKLFNELFGKYPFADEKYGHAQFGRGGGMEHQTMSFMTDFSFELQAHELAHQWFGNKVTCGSWQDIWLNEGFATYLVGLCYENLTNQGLWNTWKRLSHEKVTKELGGSVWVADTTDVPRVFDSRLTYSKGALVLHMLRWEMGDEDFFAGINNFLNAPELTFGYARTTDLQAHLEAESGRDFTEFFDDWFYGEGYPTYALNWTRTDTGLDLQVDQSTSHSSVDFFEMTLPIKVLGDGVDTLLRLEHTFSGQTYSIPLSFFPSWIEFDPDRWIISAEDQVTSASDLEAFPEINIAPNPVQDFLSVDFQGYQVEQLRLLDIKGTALKTEQVTSNVHRLAMKTLPAGTYLLEFWVGETRAIRRVLKE